LIVYAESSALLRWLLGGSRDAEVRACLGDAERVLTSRLTLVEVRRVLVRAVTLGELTVAAAAKARAAFTAELPAWDIAEVTEEIWLRAEQPFPVEPVRTLDALHLSSALRLADVLGTVAMLSTDDRILSNWLALGMPAATGG